MILERYRRGLLFFAGFKFSLSFYLSISHPLYIYLICSLTLSTILHALSPPAPFLPTVRRAFSAFPHPHLSHCLISFLHPLSTLQPPACSLTVPLLIRSLNLSHAHLHSPLATLHHSPFLSPPSSLSLPLSISHSPSLSLSAISGHLTSRGP
jgi:hypothetical protein